MSETEETSSEARKTKYKPWDRKGPWKMPKWEIQEDFVISGIAGRFPESKNVEELRENLFGKVSMISDVSSQHIFESKLFKSACRSAKLGGINFFDADFFGIHDEKAHKMDPQQRMLLEVTYEALFDAGYEASTLRGKKIGVFAGCNEKCEMEDMSGRALNADLTYWGMGVGMMAHIISNVFDFTGPSFTVDTACSASFHGFNEALLSLRTNQCEAAIVCGANICPDELVSHMFYKLGLTSKNGQCRVFDASANGYVRSEGIVVIFLQRRNQAKRCYGTILHSMLNNDGSTSEGITFPKANIQKDLYRKVYSELDIHPGTIDFMEAHGTGTVAGDREEAKGIADFFLVERDGPLRVGSVKSNLGHAEAASGLISLVKVILSMEEGKLIPNLYYDEPNPDVPALVDGTLKVITEVTPWKPGTVGINNFGFGGSNCHVVLKSNEIEKQDPKKLEVPRLVLACGRSKSAVEYIFNKVKEENFNVEAIHLLNEACMAPSTGMCYRGYTLIENPESGFENLIQKAPREKPPVWFFFTGTSSDWAGIANDMMKIGIFDKSVRKMAEFLKPLKVDLLSLLTEKRQLNESVEQSVLTTAIQIAFVDTIKALGIEFDGVIGHSTGKTAAAYAQGNLTAQETITSAYMNGKYLQHVNIMRCKSSRNVTMSENEQNTDTIDGHCLVYSYATSNILKKEAAYYELLKDLKKVMSDVPRKAVVVEFAPHSILQYVQHEILRPDHAYVGLMNCPDGNNVFHFLSSIGRLYVSSLQPAVSCLYEPVQYPVPRGTAMLNSLILWNHDKTWTVKNLDYIKRIRELTVIDTTRGSPQEYFQGYKVNDRIQFPLMAYVTIAWEMFSGEHQKTFGECPIVLEDITFSRMNYLPSNGSYSLKFKKISSTGVFQFCHCNLLLASGRVRLSETITLKTTDADLNHMNNDNKETSLTIGAEHFYKELKLRGYDLGKEFQQVVDAESSGFRGRIKWEGNWTTFLEAMLQIPLFAFPDRTQRFPNRIQTIRIDPKQLPEETEIPFFMNPNINVYKCGPVEIQGVQWEKTAKRSKGKNQPILEELVFEPFVNHQFLSEEEIKLVNEYSQVCSILAHRISRIVDDNQEACKADDSNEELVEKYLRMEKKEFVLLRLLKDALYSKDTKKKDNWDYHVERFQEQRLSLYQEKALNSEEHKKEEECKGDGSRRLDNNYTTNVMPGNYGEDQESVIGNSDSNSKDMALENTNGRGDYQSLIVKEPFNSLTVLQKLITKNLLELRNDLLSMLSLHERSLRSVLDIVQMNVNSQNIKVLEVSAESVAYDAVVRMISLNTMGSQIADYTIAETGPDTLSNYLCDSKIKLIKWDSEKLSDSQNDLVISKDLLTCSTVRAYETLQAMASAVRNDGFIVIIERTNLSPAETFFASLREKTFRAQEESKLEECFSKLGLLLVAKKTDGLTSVVYLLRKVKKGCERKVSECDVIRVPEHIDQVWVQTLIKKMIENAHEHLDRRIWLLEENSMSGILDIHNHLKDATGGENLRLIVNATLERDSSNMHLFRSDINSILRNDLSVNIYRNGVWGHMTKRCFPKDCTLQLRENAFANVARMENWPTVQWIESNLKYFESSTKSKDVILIDTYYTALNFPDVSILPGDTCVSESTLGMGFSGRDQTGRRVMGVVTRQTLSTTVAVPPGMVLEVPEDWSLEEASTVPLPYLTAYYALVVRANVTNKMSVLIHSGNSGIGQAAIAVALHVGCQVYVTVSTEEGKTVLQELYPQLEDKCFSSWEDGIFEFDVLNATKGKGVNVVFNTLQQQFLKSSLGCLSTSGVLLQLGECDVTTDKSFGMAVLMKNIAVLGIQMESMFRCPVAGNPETIECVKRFQQGVTEGVVRPIKSHVFLWNQFDEALKFMSRSRGENDKEVLIKIRDEERNNLEVPSRISIPCIPRTYCHPQKSFIVVGDLDSVGKELAHWLTERGARKLILSSRSAIRSEYLRSRIHIWKDKGVQVKIVQQQELKSNCEVKSLITEANKMAPVGGIFLLDKVFEDGLDEAKEDEEFEIDRKVMANLVTAFDSISRTQCPELDYFVLFTTTDPRSNYGISGYRNTVLKRIVEQRKAERLPGLIVQCNGIGDVGLINDRMGGYDAVSSGAVVQRLDYFLSALDRFLQESSAVVSTYVPVRRVEEEVVHHTDIIEIVKEHLGIETLSSSKANLSLKSLGMTVLLAANVAQELAKQFDLHVTVAEIHKMNIDQLNAMIEFKKDENMKDLSTPVLICEPIIPTDIIVPLNSQESQESIFFVHSMESHVMTLKRLAGLLNKRAYGLQFTKDVPHETIQDIAAHYVMKLKEIQAEGPYNLCGYSYGCLIALEMAKILQMIDLVKAVICIDNSPELAVEKSKTWFNNAENTEVFSQAPYELVADTYFRNVSKNLRAVIRYDLMDTISPLDENVGFFLDQLQSSISEEAMVAMIKQVTTLAKVILDYKSSGAFQGKVTLIKAQPDPFNTTSETMKTRDYGLKSSVDGRVEVLELACHHHQMLQENVDSTARIISARIA